MTRRDGQLPYVLWPVGLLVIAFVYACNWYMEWKGERQLRRLARQRRRQIPA
jgi:HAMP domain-containing protein